jgi:hypothetical protein
MPGQPLTEQAAVCIGCGDIVTTGQHYYEIQGYNTENPDELITLVCHAGCKVTRVKRAADA